MAKYDLVSLAQKYNGFILPQYTVSINGTKIDGKYCGQEAEFDLSADYGASVFKFIIKNAFIKKPGESIISTAKDIAGLLKLGNLVEGAVGYKAGSLKKVFSGYIDSVYVEYEKDEGIFYTVECLDGKGIMMNSIHSETKKSINKLSAAAEDIFKKYSSVIKISSGNIDKGDGENNFPIEQHNESDYDFVVRMAKKLNYDFYINVGKAYFKSVKKRNKDILIDYHINEYIKGFNFNYSLKNLVKSVTVRSNNEADPNNVFEGKASSYPNSADSGMVSAASVSKLLTDRVSRTITDYSASSVADARQKAEAYLSDLAFNMGRGQITTVGVPELFPGNVVSLKGFGGAYDRNYYVIRVKHKIDKNNFITVCEIEVNKS